MLGLIISFDTEVGCCEMGLERLCGAVLAVFLLIKHDLEGFYRGEFGLNLYRLYKLLSLL